LRHSVYVTVSYLIHVIHLRLLWLLDPVVVAVVAAGWLLCCQKHRTKTSFEVPFNGTFVFEAFTT